MSAKDVPNRRKGPNDRRGQSERRNPERTAGDVVPRRDPDLTDRRKT